MTVPTAHHAAAPRRFKSHATRPATMPRTKRNTTSPPDEFGGARQHYVHASLSVPSRDYFAAAGSESFREHGTTRSRRRRQFLFSGVLDGPSMAGL